MKQPDEQTIFSPWTARALYLYFTVFFVGFVVAFTVAALEIQIDHSVILMSDTPHGTDVHSTPLQHHPHALGGVYQSMIIGHVVTAHLLIVLCVAYLYATLKKRALHRYRRLFIALWVPHLANGGIPAMHRLMTHGLDERNYTVGFSLGHYVLFLIVVCLLCGSLAQVVLLDRTQGKFSTRDILLMKSGVLLSFSAYALCFVMGFFIQFLAGDAFIMTRERGYGIILMAFSGQAFLANHSLVFARAAQRGTARPGDYRLEQSRNLMLAIFFTEMTFLLNVSYRLGLERFNSLLWLGIGLLCWRYARRAFLPVRTQEAPDSVREGRAC